VIGGLLVPGPQEPKNAKGGPGAIAGVVSGIASRSHYAWAGVTYQRYTGHKPDLLFYSLAYAYRPPSWRTDSGWDWRIFGELTGERSGLMQGPGPNHQVFVGPTTLGVYKNIAVSAGVQFPVYRAIAPVFPRERVRFAVDFSYFF
jgi:hypothetical protein